MNSEIKKEDGYNTGLWNAGEISNYLKEAGLEVQYSELSQDNAQHSLVQGMDQEVNYNVFNLGSPEDPELKAVMSFEYEEASEESSLISKPSLRDILHQLGNPDMVNIKEDRGRIYVTSDLSSAAPGAIAEEFSELYSEVKQSDILGH